MRTSNSILERILVAYLCSYMGFFPMAGYAASVETDGTTQTTVDTARNGVTVVNIANPNSNGLSHNKFTRYNVNQDGLILNNAKNSCVSTKLGGYIYGNKNLTTNASVILNEVTSTQRSRLNGFTEIAGRSADLVVANPNGITVNGAGFINTNAVTLTTGRPNVVSGRLDSLAIGGGDIAIEGDGLNSNGTSSTHLYTQTLQLNAALHAQNLDIKLGHNTVGYADKAIRTSQNSGATGLLLDASALGGMYANSITLVGTDQGLGVNLPPEVVASTGDINISNDGKVTLQTVNAAQQVNVSASGDIDLTDQFYAGSSSTLSTTANIMADSGVTAAKDSLTVNADTVTVNSTATLMAGLNNDGTQNSSGVLTLNGNSVDNSGTIQSSGDLDLAVAANLSNGGKLKAGYNLGVRGSTVTNDGLVVALNDLSISSTNLTNNMTLYAGNDMGLYTVGTLRNNPDANILAMNDITMARNSDGSGKSNLIVNDRANIESLNGDIAINANTFRNRTDAPVVRGTYVPEVPYQPMKWDSQNLVYIPAVEAVPAYISGGTREVTVRNNVRCANPWHCWNDIKKVTTAHKVVNNPVPATIYAGANLTLNADNITNKYSLISAQGDIDLAAQVVDNNPVGIIKIVTRTVDKWRNVHSCDILGRCSDKTRLVDTVVTTTETPVTVAASTIQAGGSITGNVANLSNGNINSGVAIAAPGAISVDDSIALPGGTLGLFITSRDPNSQYLIETNPEFALKSNFLSSDYFLENIGFEAESTFSTTRRLGDAFYENKLVRESILEQTGRRFLTSEITDDNQQYKYLMDNAFEAHEDLQLIPGVALTEAQIGGLKKDIVWMVEREVAGQTVLVPTVYIANPDDYTVRGGMIIAGDELEMQVAELANAGLMEAGGNMNVTATDAILNYGGEMSAGGDLALTATNNIENVSGTIEGNNVALTSTEGDIVNRRYTEERSGSSTHGTYDYTAIGDAANIVAQNGLSLDAADTITVEGSNLSGSDVSLNAETVDIVTTVENIDYAAKSGGVELKEQSTTHYGSAVEGNNIAINSGGKTTVAGSTVSAEKQLDVTAGELDILAVNNTTYDEYKGSSSSMFSSETTQTKQATSTNIGASLTGGDIRLTTTEGDINVVGSTAAAENTLALNSAGNINVQAGYDGEMNESRTEKSGFGGGDFYSESIDVEGRMATTAVKAQLRGGTVEMNAANDLNLIGVDVAANEISGSAENINIENVHDQETTWSKHEKMSVSLADVAKTMTDPSALIKTEGGKASFKLAEADYSNIENSTTTRTVVGSSLDADNITLNASSVDDAQGCANVAGAGCAGATKGNIAITGSDLAASDTIALLATGDVDIKEAKNSQQSDTKEQSGHGELNVTVKNEYVEIGTAIETAKAAEKALEEANKSYDNYKKELAKQKAHLAQLKQDLADGKLGIEQADIDELATFIDDLKSDDAYYQANIALAVADLATKTAAVAKQMATAAASSGTYGFNVGVELDLDMLEKRYGEYREQSVGSNLVADNLTIRAGQDTTIRGSNLAADNIAIETENLNILASQDLSTNTNSSEHLHTNVSMSVYGGSGTSFSASADRSQGGGSDITHTNSQLQGNTITLTTRDTTTIAGANVAAADTLSLDTQHLIVESVQDSHESHNAGAGLNIDGSSTPASAGINGSVSHSRSRETVLTTLTGGNVAINVAEDTTLTGATIAAIDENGEDNGQLSLKTGTLTVNALSNTTYSTATSANIGMGSTVSIDASSDTSHSKTKTLGTIGEGNIQVANIDDSDTKLLNRDVTDNEVDIYAIESHKGLKGSLDTRFLTEQGRDQIAEDVMKSGMIVDTIKLIVTTEKVGIEDFFSETDKSHTTYETVKETIAKDPKLAAMLQDPNLSAKDKEAMLNKVTGAVMKKLGYETYDNIIVAKPNDENTGFYSEETQNAYINDARRDNTTELVTTAGHEMAHAMDYQTNGINDTYSQADRDTYANSYGSSFAAYTDMALDINGYGGMASSNGHTGNDSLLVWYNNQEYDGLDKRLGDAEATPLGHGTIHSETDIFRTKGYTYDTGNLALDYLYATGDTINNTAKTTVNLGSALLSSPVIALAAAEGISVADADKQIVATLASTGPLALPLLTGESIIGGSPVRMLAAEYRQTLGAATTVERAAIASSDAASVVSNSRWVDDLPPLPSMVHQSGILEDANYAQKTFGKNFSSAGKFAGQSVNDVAAALESGNLKPSDVPIDYITRNGNTLILNTRSSQALTQAGIPRSQWNAVNRTGDAAFEARLTGQLQRNNLTEAGISTVRQSGGQ
ncbi:hemagglutinin repeat-containing protein [Sedimenticola sp.]|uniref:two-partner secretion domain-containing protein n=1 Tax=Sedimenticola sp. TaxID=1940285 RepID=UPI003D1250B7